MVERFDRLLLVVPALAQGIEQYTRLLGEGPVSGEDDRGEWALWLLPNTAIELREAVGASRIRGLALSMPDASAMDSPQNNSLGLNLYLCDGSVTARHRAAGKAGYCDAFAVDHLVLRTSSADDCVALFGDTLGIRLALDKTVPQWGGRMLFFRAGKLTLEVIDAQDDSDAHNVFWGVAYQCQNIDAAASALATRGVTLSPVREGRKPGTRVATVKSHCLDIPTLLVEPAR